MKIFSGSSNRDLVEDICTYLGKPLGNLYLKQFPSGEQWCQFGENIRGEDVYIVQSLSNPVNDNLMQLLVIADAAKRASANRLTAVIPYFGYARQDRKDSPRTPISAKLVMNLIASSGFDRVLTMDLHAPQIGGFTDLLMDHLSFKPILLAEINKMNIDAIVAPDIGAVKRADEYSRSANKKLVILTKERHDEKNIEVNHFIGDVTGKNVIIIDDLTESAGTLIGAAKACKEHKANKIYCGITHGCFTKIGLSRLVDAFRDNLITEVLVSNTVNTNIDFSGIFFDEKPEVSETYLDKIKYVDVSSTFAKAILSIAHNQSISELFK